MRNHGDGVIVVKQHLQFWNYKSIVGSPLSWRLKKQNVNNHGSSFICWNSQYLNSLHKSQSTKKDEIKSIQKEVYKLQKKAEKSQKEVEKPEKKV